MFTRLRMVNDFHYLRYTDQSHSVLKGIPVLGIFPTSWPLIELEKYENVPEIGLSGKLADHAS